MHPEDQDSERIVEIHAGQNLDHHFETLFNLYFERVVYFFRGRGFDPDSARDLAQETFLLAFRNIAQFRGDGRFLDWLFRIAANVWKNRLRTLGTAKRSAIEVSLTRGVAENERGELAREPESLTQPADQLDSVLATERLEALREAVDGLPPQMRRCVFLRLRDLKYSEIATRLQLTVGTVKTQIHLARRRLKELLKDDFEDLPI